MARVEPPRVTREPRPSFGLCPSAAGRLTVVVIVVDFGSWDFISFIELFTGPLR